MASQLTVGSKAFARSRACEILVHDTQDPGMTYKVLFDDGSVDWFKQEDVTSEPGKWPPVAKPAPFKGLAINEVANPKSLEAFFERNRYFLVPWIIFYMIGFVMGQTPRLNAYFESRNMEYFGIAAALRLAVWSIITQYAVHGWIVANHKELMEKGLKVVKSMPYDFTGSGDASIRSSLIYFVGMTLYAFVPMWHGAGETWVQILFEFLLGYLILLIGGDAWFFMVHYMAHTPKLYALMHKTHHKWKYPTAFSAYYITSGTHFVQEHLFTIPALLFLPVPWSAFLFYQYYGVPAAQINHCGFNLDEVRIPFCGALTLGNIMSVCGLGLTHILGSQTIAAHDYHHETFMGNFQLSYSYLDKLFGVYVNPKARLDIEESLLGV